MIDPQEIIEEFYNTEVDNWKLLSDNLDLLNDSIDNEKELMQISDENHWGAYCRLVNYRKGSLTAKIDKKSIEKRPCFLCEENRPEDQGVLEFEDYEILANPYPIADLHLTIAHKEHRPQRIKGRIKDMARIARLMPGNCVFYNGPLCGASAPDHLHFQALQESIAMNMWRPVAELEEILKIGKSRIYAPKEGDTLFPYFIIISAADKELVEIFDIIYNSLPAAEPEPMMNIVMHKDGGKMRTMIVPRQKHRPSFYGSGEGEMLISPASVEMLGTFITSRQEDFDRMDAETVKKTYDEVCMTRREFDTVVEKIKNHKPK